MRKLLLGCALLLLARAPLMSQAPAGSSTRAELQRARQLVSDGNFATAESLYLAIVESVPAPPRDLHGAAYFGRAFAAQQRLRSGSGVTPLDTILSDYAKARDLSQRSIRISADNNSGLVLQSSGRHAEAVPFFLAAAKEAGDTERAQYLVNAGRAYEASGDSSRAARTYERALSADTTASEALRALLRLHIASAPSRVVLDVMDRWQTDSINGAVVVEAIPELMLRANQQPTTADVGRALIYLATSMPIARTSPSTFNVTLRNKLLQVAPQHRQVADGINALVDAFAMRSDDSTFQEPATSKWWRSDFGSAHLAWSGLLRWLGDWYLDQSETAVARSFYEAAIGKGDELQAPWVDRKALLPLALIYSETDPSSEATLNARVSRFTEIMFSGKAAAYQKGDLQQIREFHTALGAYYAGRGKWTGDGWQNAEYQLRQMRVATRSLSEQTRRQIIDPPELLERLGQHYVESGKRADAERLKVEIQSDFRVAGRRKAGEAIARRIDLPATTKVVPDTVVKPTRRALPTVLRPTERKDVPPPAVRPRVDSVPPRADSVKTPEGRSVLTNTIFKVPVADTKQVVKPTTETVTTLAFRVVEIRVMDAATGAAVGSAVVVPVINGDARAALQGALHSVRVPLRVKSASVRVSAPGYVSVDQPLGAGERVVIELRKAR